ncbi:MAG: ribosomal protein S18-alanine N-acetyltransferase [Terriglobia bacterium]
MISVRRATPRDIRAILAIQASVFQSAAWGEEDYRRMLDEQANLLLVGAHQEIAEPVGYAAARTACGEAELLHLAVAPACQRSGVGSALVKEICRKLRIAGVDIVFLEVRPSNTPALNLYTSLGFTPVSVRKGYYSQPLEDARVLSLALSGDKMAGSRAEK